jgi:hypothetical protein
MRKRNLLRILLFNSLCVSAVPDRLQAAFESPNPNPLTFALANLISFPDELILPLSEPPRFQISASGARLFGMPEIQPIEVHLSAPALSGIFRLRGTGLSSGSYREMTSALAYERTLPEALSAGLELQVMQVAIEGYGDAWALQVNPQLRWQPKTTYTLAFVWHNLTGARFGQDDYLLPQRLAIGGRISPHNNLVFFLELEQEVHYDLAGRFGACFSPLKGVAILGALQNQPNIFALGFSALIRSVRASLAFQYHPDLGFSQCYGLAVAF